MLALGVKKMDKLTLGYVYPLTPFQDHLFGNPELGFDQFFSEFLNPSKSKGIAGRFYPKIDMWREGESLKIEATVPGLKKENLTLSLEGDILIISGETISKIENKLGNESLIKEIKRSAFSRSLKLPPIEGEYPEPIAKMENGILSLYFENIFKNSTPKKKLIDIK